MNYALLVLLVIATGCNEGVVVPENSGNPEIEQLQENNNNTNSNSGDVSVSPDGGDVGDVGGGGGNVGSSEVVLKQQLFEPAAGDVLNPERGMFRWIDLLDKDEDFSGLKDENLTLGYASVELETYKDITLPESFLNTLREGFGLVRAAGYKVVLRFSYSDTTDAPLDAILGHIGQLKPVLQDNADVITWLEAGFIGKWGEWHSSSYGLDNPVSREKVLDALLDAMPASRTVLVRKPSFKTEYPGEKSRIGHHNDCFLASLTDKGTYPSSAIEFWKDYIAEDSLLVPVGGETCGVFQPRSDCPTALEEMARLHWSYLNSGYHPDVIANWKAQGCFDDIHESLGYHLVLNDINWNEKVKPGGALTVKLAVTNEGFAALHNERPAYLILNGAGCYITKLPVDPRLWAAGERAEFSLNMGVPSDIKGGVYSLYMWLPDAAPSLQDDPRYAIKLANADVWQEDGGYNLLVNAGIEPDPSAPTNAISDTAFTACQ